MVKVVLSTLVKLIREGLGRFIALISWLTRGKAIKRDKSMQARVNEACSDLALYEFYACPFCIKTRRTLHKLRLPIQRLSAQDGAHRADLEQGGGRVKVPCLRIKEQGQDIWMYESNDIIHYLQERFSA